MEKRCGYDLIGFHSWQTRAKSYILIKKENTLRFLLWSILWVKCLKSYLKKCLFHWHWFFKSLRLRINKWRCQVMKWARTGNVCSVRNGDASFSLPLHRWKEVNPPAACGVQAAAARPELICPQNAGKRSFKSTRTSVKCAANVGPLRRATKSPTTVHRRGRRKKRKMWVHHFSLNSKTE